MDTKPTGPGADGGGSWGGAAVKAVAMMAISVLSFVLIPNMLLGYLTSRMTPDARDLVVVAWWIAAFVIDSWIFVRLQRRQRA